MAEEESITFDQKMILQIEAIIMDRDKDAALRFIEEYIHRPIRKRKESHCKPGFK
jgi:hypothetical protein